MKKRCLFITVYICLLLGFICGASELICAREERMSDSENRMLQGIPALSADSLLNGAFMSELENYLSDTFFFRNEAADFTDRTMGLFDLTADDPDTGEIAQEQLFAPGAQDEAADTGSTPEASVSIEAASDSDTASTDLISSCDIPPLEDAVFYLEGTDGSKTVTITYPADRLASFASILNSYRDALPEDGTLSFAVPPVSGVANNILHSSKYCGWGTTVDEILQPVVNDGVYIYDVADILEPYLGTLQLYPVEDHHWHPISASIVAGEMLRRQGVIPMDFYEYRYYISTYPRSKAYYGDALKSLNLSIDTVTIMEPVSPAKSYIMRDLDKLTPSVFVGDNSMALLAYLGGLNGPWRLIDTGFNTGRTALVIGDSFELTFTPFLAPYYDQILVTDLRESLFSLSASGGTIREYIEYYGVDDIYMLYSTYSPFTGDMTQEPLIDYLG